MSLRDWIAGMALQGMLANGFMPDCADSDNFNHVLAAYELADQMLAVREDESHD